MEKYGFVYIWFDRKHKRYYIGCHWGNEDDGYICSSPWMRNSFNRRPEDFKRKVITRVYTNRNDLYEEEYRWLSMIKPEELHGVKYYNIKVYHYNHWAANKESNINVKQKLSNASILLHQDPEYKAKFEEGRKKLRGKKQSSDFIEKRRQSMINTMAEKFPEENRWKKLSSEERKEYYSEKAKKNWSIPGHKEKVGAKISQSLKGVKNRLGHKNTDEHTAKIIEANKIKAREKMESYRPLIEQTLHMTAIEASKIVGVGRQIVTKYRKELGYNK